MLYRYLDDEQLRQPAGAVRDFDSLCVAYVELFMFISKLENPTLETGIGIRLLLFNMGNPYS